MLGGLVFGQAAALVFLSTTAGAGIVATGLWHSGRPLYQDWRARCMPRLLADGRLYELLQHCDDDLAAEQRAGGCPRCGGVLHWACYPRKPRGVPRGLIPEYGRRLSFCCARRELPQARHAAVVALSRAQGLSGRRGGADLGAALWAHAGTHAHARGADRGEPAHVVRWRRWWCEELLDTPFWRAAAGGLMPPVQRARVAGLAAGALCGSRPGSIGFAAALHLTDHDRERHGAR